MTKSDKFLWPFCHPLFPSCITHSMSLGNSRNSAHFWCQLLLVSSSRPLFNSSSEWVFDKKKYVCIWGFPDSSVGKEFTCNAGDPSSIPWLGRSAGEGIGYPLQCSGLENWGRKESDTTEQLSFHFHLCIWRLFWRKRNLRKENLLKLKIL